MGRVDIFRNISNESGIPVKDLPTNFQILGKALMVDFSKIPAGFRKKLAKVYAKNIKTWVVYQIDRIDDAMRIPHTEILTGVSTPITHLEDGIIYRFDPSTIMFSKGNKFERHRLAGDIDPSETVVDMFGGIGYYSIPISLQGARVYSCEINPDSFHYLVVNKRLNRADTLIPVFGDSITFPYDGIADRILMGHFDSFSYLGKAIMILKDQGIIHLHTLEKRKSNEMADRLKKFEEIVKIQRRKVKSYSPSTDHIVYDIEVNK